MTKTYWQSQTDIDRVWYEVDAAGWPLGRLATQISRVLSGKDKPTFSPNIDNGDYVVVVNAAQLHLSGKKASESLYHYSGYPGGLKSTSKGQLLEQNPSRLLEHAVRGMLPKNKLLSQRIKRLKIYDGQDHEHAAQKPQKLEIKHGK